MASLLSAVRTRFFDKSNKPLAGGKVYTYEANSTNPKVTWSDEALTVQNTNPVLLDNEGTALIFFSGKYRFRIEDKYGILVEDNPSVTSQVGVDELTSELVTTNISDSPDQNDLNKKSVTTVESIADMLELSVWKGRTVTVKSYNINQGEGGGTFVATQKNGLVANNTTVFDSNDSRFKWVRINYEFLTPEMCGAKAGQDSTDAIERFFNTCGTGIKGQASEKREYLLGRQLDCTFSSNVNIDFGHCSLKPNFTINPGEVPHTALLTSSDGTYMDKLSVLIRNANFDLSLIPFSISTNGEDRRGIYGLAVSKVGSIVVENYYCKNAFYGAGLHLTHYNSASLKNIEMVDVGSKINPFKDDTGNYDAAGDAIYLGNVRGNGITSIENARCISFQNYLGRGGVVLENDMNVTLSHVVTMANCHFDGYHRVIHEEDGGKGTVFWNSGSAKRFSNLLYNLGGVADQIYFTLSDVTIEVDPPYSYGGTSGITNFQGFGDCSITGCNIDYLSNVTERGNKFVYNSNVNVKALVDHGVSTKPHVLSGNTINIYSNYLFYTSTNKGLSSISNTYNNLSTSNNIIDGIRCTSNLVSSLKDTFNNVSLFCENTLPIGIGKNKINGSTFNYTKESNSVLFFSSYLTGYELNNCTIRSLNATLGLRGDGFVGYKIYNSDLYNVKILTSNITFNQNHVLDLTSSNLTYDTNYNDTTPILAFGQLIGMVKGNNFYNNSNVAMSLPNESSTFLYKNRGNVMIKSETITPL